MRQNDLFGSLNLKPKAPVTNDSIQNAIKRVDDAKRKYQPSVVLPQYSILRQKIILVENLVRQGKIKQNPNYITIRDKDTLWKAMKNIKVHKKLPWDSETDSLDPITANLVGISFHEEADFKDYYIPFLHCDAQRNIYEGQLTYDDFLEVAGDVWTDQNIRKITHNATFDNRILKRNLNIVVRGQYWDTLLFMNAIDENHKNNKLKKLYAEFIDPNDSGETYESLFEGIPFCFVPIDTGTLYAAGDSYKTNAVYEWQRNQLSPAEYSKMLKHYIDTEVKQLEVVSAMEDRGVHVNNETANTLLIEYTELSKVLEQKLTTFFGNYYGLQNINYNSPDQMATIIYDKMRCESVDKKKPRGTGEEIIEKLVAKNPEVAILKDLLTYRGTQKLINTYLEAIPKQVSAKTGALHARFHSHGARTGRYSSSDPNLQNIPSHFNDVTLKDDSRIRNIFVPRPGYVWLSGDYSQIEIRILAYRSNDASMINAYNTGQDLYSLMAAGVYNLSYEQCLESYGADGKIRRTSMKNVLLGLMYGRQSASIGQQLGMSKKEADKFIEAFFNKYPNIKNYIDETIRIGTLLGYVTTIYDRRRRLPDLNSPIDFKKQEAQRQAVNATIQGSSASITKRAMWALYNNEWINTHDCHQVLTIHDEVVLEVPKDIINEAGQVIRSCMVSGAQILTSVMPVTCDIEVFEIAWNLDGYHLN